MFVFLFFLAGWLIAKELSKRWKIYSFYKPAMSHESYLRLHSSGYSEISQKKTKKKYRKSSLWNSVPSYLSALLFIPLISGLGIGFSHLREYDVSDNCVWREWFTQVINNFLDVYCYMKQGTMCTWTRVGFLIEIDFFAFPYVLEE